MYVDICQFISWLQCFIQKHCKFRKKQMYVYSMYLNNKFVCVNMKHDDDDDDDDDIRKGILKVS